MSCRVTEYQSLRVRGFNSATSRNSRTLQTTPRAFLFSHLAFHANMFPVIASTVGTILNAVRLEEGVYMVGDSSVSLESVFMTLNAETMSLACLGSCRDRLLSAQQGRGRQIYSRTRAGTRRILVRARSTVSTDYYREMLPARKKGEDPNWPR